MRRYTQISNKLLILITGIAKTKTGSSYIYDNKYFSSIEKQYPKELFTRKFSLCEGKIVLSLLSFCNSSGEIPFILIEELSNAAGCSERTIRNTLKMFDELKLIRYESSRGFATISLLNYDSFWVDYKKRGTGYALITDEALIDLLKIKSVNVFRVSFRILLEMGKNDTEDIIIDKEMISYYLPKYKKHKKAVKEIIANLPSYFKDKKIYEVDNLSSSGIREVLHGFKEKAKVLINNNTYQSLKDGLVLNIKSQIGGKEKKAKETRSILQFIYGEVAGDKRIDQERLFSHREDIISLTLEYGLDKTIPKLKRLITYLKDKQNEHLLLNGGSISENTLDDLYKNFSIILRQRLEA